MRHYTSRPEDGDKDVAAPIPAGRPYFVMELVKGRPITKFCDEERLSTSQRLELFIAVCRAIQHAHQKGLVHRDLKPSNVMVSFVDGKPVPKIIDFGIAKAMQHDLTDKTVFTRFHQFMGTPAYMSPEQAGTDSADIDTRSDIYSLGTVLYELLTGRTPMDSREIASADYDEIRRQIREVEPSRPSNRISTLTAEERTTVAQSRSVEPAKLSRLVRGDLDWIVLKAMEKDRNRRYETANEFAKDIQRYLDSEPVAARKPSMGYVLQKFARRHKVALATAACFVLLLTVGVCVSTAQAIKNKSLFTAAEEAKLAAMNGQERETELRRIAETERGQSEVERDRSQSFLYTAHMNLAQRAWNEENLDLVTDLLDLQRPQPGHRDLRNFEWFYLDRLSHSESELLTLKGHTSEVMSVTFSPDGKRVATASHDYTVRVWDATSGKETLTLNRGGNSVAFSPDGKRLALAGGESNENTVWMWDAITGQETHALRGHARSVWSVAFSADGKRLASASSDGTVKVWDPTTGQETLTFKMQTIQLNGMALSPDGTQLATASFDKTVRVWDATTGQETLKFNGLSNVVWGVTFSPDGKRLAAATWGGNNQASPSEVKVWDATTGHELLTLRGHTRAVRSVAFSPDGKRLASAGDDGRVKVWDATTGQEIFALRTHTDIVWSVAFSPDGKRLASACNDETVKVWDVTSDQETPTLKGHSNWVSSVAFSPDGKRLASASWDKTVKVWDAVTGQETLTFKGHTNEVASVAFSPNGERLASGSSDGTVKVWNATTGQETLTLKSGRKVVRSVAFSPDGKRLASASGDPSFPNNNAAPGEVNVWDTTTGQQLLTFRGHSNHVETVAFSPDGKRLASAGGGRDDEIRVWDATTGQEMLTLKGFDSWVRRVAFSPDGKRLAAAGNSTMLAVWDATTGKQTLKLKGHSDLVWSVTFSPDGNRLVSASRDRTVKVWDATTGQETLTLKGHNSSVTSVTFGPDGNRLASASSDKTVKIWDARPRSEPNTPKVK